MTRDDWLNPFEDELKKLRPHLTSNIAGTIALQAYSEQGHPCVAARTYHAKLQPPKSAPAKKRAKR